MNQQPQASCYIEMDSKNPFINEPQNPSCFFSSILSCIHCYIMCRLKFKVLFEYLSFMCHFRWQIFKSCCRSKSNLERIVDCSNQLKSINAQIPKHVCVIINENIRNIENKYQLIVTIIECLGTYGVQEITFYQFHPFDIRLDRINNFTRQHEVFSKLKIKFLSNHTGSQCIMVDVCKNVADNLLKNNIELDGIDQNLIDHKVIELSDMSEPGMLLLIGIYDHLSNFSPWHIRLSEIIKIPSYKLVNRISIRDAIIRYNKIEKRFGK